MHKLMLSFFNFIRSCLYFIRMVTVFFILMLTLYWIQDLLQADWGWIKIFAPFFDFLLAISYKISSYSFDVFGISFEMKYLIAVIILTAISYIFKHLDSLVDIIENFYKKTRNFLHKTEEFVINKQLQSDAKEEQSKLKKFNVHIQTELKTKYSNENLNINIDEQNKLMNDFLIKKTGIMPSKYKEGFVYQFYDFDKIDETLDILFKLINSEAPIKYAISIQVGNNIEQFDKIIDLKHFGKISMAADTNYRYKFNKIKKYKTAQIGLFQYKDDTLELHEFKENL